MDVIQVRNPQAGHPAGSSVSTSSSGDLREQQIALWTLFLTAAEVAQRLGYRGNGGVLRARRQMASGVIPAWKQGNEFRAHWPTVVKALTK